MGVLGPREFGPEAYGEYQCRNGEHNLAVMHEDAFHTCVLSHPV